MRCSLSLFFLATIVPAAELVEVRKIWDHGSHNAFTDLIRFKNNWYCTFREADGHVGGDGKLRVLTSKDAVTWKSAALLAEEGIDLRDPKLSIAPGNRLMIVAGGSVYQGTKILKGRQPRVAFSKDGVTWTRTQRVLNEGDWLWRVTWFKGRAYGVSYDHTAKPDWALRLAQSDNGVDWRITATLNVPGRPNETTLRFLDTGECIALIRREGDPKGDKVAWIGRALPPYKDWSFAPAGFQLGGPNFIVLKDGTLVGGGRDYREAPKRYQTMVGALTRSAFTPQVHVPSGGDTSYPGFVHHNGMLWMSYYSSHEGKTSIYLAKIRL